MQNYKKNFVTRTLAWVLAAVMVIAMVPVGVFAETYTTVEEVDNGSGQKVKKEVTKTTDWSETFRKDLEKTSDYWGLSQTNVLIPTPNDPVKTFNIRYVGRYTRPDGREVVRLLTTFRVDTANVWKNLLVKFPEDFVKMIDTTDEMTGLTTGPGAYGDHDRTDMENIKKSFNEFKQGGSPLGWDLAGGKNVYAFNMHQGSDDCYFPLDLVLIDGASVDNLKEDVLVQARLTDKKYKRIYKRVDAKLDTYMQYTNATVIPIKKNEDMTVAKDLYGMYDVGVLGDNKIHSTVSTVNYNLEKGYIDIFYRLRQAALGDMNKSYGLRLSMDSSFYGLIQEQKGIAGVVFTLDQNGKFYPGRGDNGTFEPNMNTSAPFTKSQISTQNGLNILQVINGAFPRSQDNTGNKYVVAKSDTSVAILNGALASSNQGVITVIRLYVDRERLYSTIKEKGIGSYNFETQVIRPDEDGTSLYEWKADSDIELKRGDKVTLKFDSNRVNRTAVQIIVGTEDRNIDFINTINYTDKRNAEWTVPFDIKIKKGEMFVVRAVNGSNNTGAVKVFFNTKKIVDISKKEVSHKPLYYRNSAASTGGVLVGTSLRANVDEIFTDSPKITGHSYFEGAEVNIVANETSTDDETDVTQQMIAAKGSDKDPDDFSKAADDALQKYYNENVYTDARYVDGKLFKAFEYDTDKPNNGGRAQKDENGKNFVREYEKFQMPNLSNEKDGQILVTNRDAKTSIFHSDSVKEQVQAKFKFDLNGQTSVLGNFGTIEKIAPLNKEFKYTITEYSDPNDSAKLLYKAVKNNKYKASGFETDNLRVETEKVTDPQTSEEKEQVKKVKVFVEQGKPGEEGYKRIEREMPSYLDHDNRPYDLTAKDADIDGYIKSNYDYLSTDEKVKLKKQLTEDIIKSENERLFKRSMPETDEINVPSGKKLIGWTTVKLEDKNIDGRTVSAEEQYYDLYNSVDSDGKQDKIIRDVKDWKKVDEEQKKYDLLTPEQKANAKRDVYVFDKDSPIDKTRTVYAVYGGLSIVLHSGIKDSNGNYIIKRVPITQSDIDNNFDNLDGLTSASINKYRQNNNIFVKTGMPEAPYTYREKDVEAADPLLKEFIKPNSSFVGWWAPNSDDIEIVKNNQNSDKEALMFARQNDRFNAGDPIDYNERIAGLISGKLKIGNTVKNTVKSAEDLTHMMKNNSYAVLPNGFKFVFTPNDFKVDGKLLKTNDEVFDKINEIHLYAVYREFFDVTVHPRYSKIDRTSARPEDQIDKNNIRYGDYGKYEGAVEADKQKDLKISLLTRTAVTGYGEPTAAANANYEPITDLVPQEPAGNIDNEIFKTWNHTTNEALKWTLPGFDKLGRRKSYVAVVVQAGKENAYKQFGIPEFNDRTWGTLGIQVYLKAGGVSLDENAPKNLHKNETNRDAYGYALAKTQTVTFKKQNPQEGVDAFTMATSRKSIVKTGKNEVSGYDIIMTNSPVEIPVPKFAEPIRTTDQVVALEWPSDNYTEKDFEDIAKVKIKLALKKEENQPQQYKEFELTIDPTTKEITTTESGITAEIKTGKVHDNETDRKLLFIRGLDLNGTGGNTINAWYSKKQGEDYSIGEPGYAVIIGIRTSEKVSEMKQTAKVNPEDKPKIEFVIPEKTLDKVTVGTKYVAEKWVPDQNDPTKGQWVKVGEKVLTDADKTGTNFDNVKTTIELDENPATGSGIEPVKDGDIVRIVSYEKNPDAIYTEEEKANGAIDGYALPNYSTRKEIQDPKDQNKTIDVPAITEAPSKATQNHRPENIEYVKLDLKAPVVTDAVAKEDDPFRRFIDITAQLDEVPDGQEVTIEFGDVQGKKENFKKTFTNKTEAIKYLNQIPRREDMPKMWIIAKDRFGNQKPVEATYNKTYQMYVAIIQPHAGDDFIEALADKAGAEIVIKVLNEQGVEVARAKGTAQAAGEYEVLDIYTVENGEPTTTLYELKASEVLVISASKTEGGKEYTTNPLSLEVLN